MKYLLHSFALLFTSHIALSQGTHEVKIPSKIDAVTVFVTGGEISQTAVVPVKAGRNKLVFTGISTVADNKSVQFNSDKEYNLVSVSSEIDYLSIVENNPRLKKLQDSLQILQDEIIDLQNEKSAYLEEKNLLAINNKIKGETANLTVAELKAMAEYYRTRIMELNKLMTTYDKRVTEKNMLLWRYQNQLTELNYKETIRSNQIIVMIDVPAAATMNIDLKYIVSNCGWQANYDLRADDLAGKITIRYKAKVFNNTGNDWNDVALVLSTSDPNISASAPTLYPWYLNYSSFEGQGDYNDQSGYVVPQNRQYSQYYSNASEPEISQNLDGLALDNSFGWNAGGSFNPTTTNPVTFETIEVSQLTTEFKIEKKYSIPSDSKPYLVDITEHNLTATFSHKAVPKLDNDAFVLANIVGWERLDLVPGPTNVYFADNYVGQSYINTAHVEDTLRLSFGRDKKIVITRKLLEEFSDKKVVGANRRDAYVYEISLKNNHTTAAVIDLFDQVPISQDSDIGVTVEEVSGAEHNLTTGILKWLVKLEPGETKKFKLSFVIKYPKDRVIVVKKYRKMTAAKF